MYHLPLQDIDKLLTGDEVPFFQDAVHQPDESGPFWRDANVLCGFEHPTPSTHIVTGWSVHATASQLRPTRGARSRTDALSCTALMHRTRAHA